MKTKVITKFVFISFLLMSLLAFNSNEKKKVLFFGDSITYLGTRWDSAYINLISIYAKESVIDDVEFIGSGVPGDRVTDLYLRMDKDILSKSPDIVVIYIGVNDIWHKALSGTGTDYKKFGLFYDAIVDKLIDNDIKIVLCTPACIGERTDFTNEFDGDLNKYSHWIREFASTNSIPLVDLRKSFLAYNKEHNIENLQKGVLTADGVHLNPEGNILVANEIWTVLKEILIK